MPLGGCMPCWGMPYNFIDFWHAFCQARLMAYRKRAGYDRELFNLISEKVLVVVLA